MKRGKYVIKHNESYAFNKEGEPTLEQTSWWWVYVAPNGEIVCQSEILSSKAACLTGIASVKRSVFSRVVVE